MQTWAFLALPEDYIYLILGGILGLLYALDGWRGDEKKDFKDTKRVKNFLWVLCGAFYSLTSNLGGYSDTNKKTTALNVNNLFHFLIGFIIILSVVLIFWGIVICIKFSRIRKHTPQNYPDGLFSPALDYLYYGYGWLKDNYNQRLIESKKELADLNNLQEKRDFLSRYSESLSYCIATVEAYREKPEETARQQLVETILQTVCKLVEEHHAITLNGGARLSTNSNIMLLKKREAFTDNELLNRVVFHNGNPKTDLFLELCDYAKHDGKETFMLPVDKVPLPGAPEAIVTNMPVVIDNTLKIDYNKNIPKKIKKEMDGYFKKKLFHTFASLIILKRGVGPIGVLNIEANINGVFSDKNSPDRLNERVKLIYPFTCLLGCIL